MIDRAILGSVLIVAPYLSVLEYSQMILAPESVSPAQADEFAGVLPCDEVVPEIFLNKERHEVAYASRVVDYADEYVLSARVPHDADSRGDVTHVGMKGGVCQPEQVLEPVTD